MEYNLDSFSFKDKKIIKSNPDKTPYELLELGISQPGYARLVEQYETGKVEESKQTVAPEAVQKPKVTKEEDTIIAQPKIIKPEEPKKPTVQRRLPGTPKTPAKIKLNSRVRLHDKATGKTRYVDAAFAQKLIRGSMSNQYKIV